MLLVTREHIGLLDKEHPFIATTIKRSYRSVQFGQEFDVLFAVVDRIPFPKASRHLGVYHQFLLSHRSAGGHGGISVATMNSSLATPDLWTSDAGSTRRTNMDFGKHSTLSVCFAPAGYGDREVQMPVANTTFVNGRSATLLAQRWTNGTDPSSPNTLVCTKEKELQNQKVYVTSSEDPVSLAHNITFDLRLRRLTPTRVVSAAIGNIVRQIVFDDLGGQPASQELERSIGEQIESGRLERNTVEVWALLHSQRTASGDPPSNPEIDIPGEISKGARLLKVLSGGGGWGEKQGLLALDPDPDYRSEDAEARNFENSEEMFADIVKCGDRITFLVSDVGMPEAHVKNSWASGPGAGQRRITLPEQLLEFGCLPSTMDETPDPNGKDKGLPFGSSAILIRKYFGVLSEAGMSLMVRHFAW